MGSIRKDYTGETIGNWTVLGFSHKVRSHSMWHVRCNCGEKRVYAISNLHRNTRCNRCLGHHFSKGSGPIYEARRVLGITQREFASRTGINRATIAKFEARGTFFEFVNGGAESARKFNRFMRSQGRPEFCQPVPLFKPIGTKRVVNYRYEVKQDARTGEAVHQLAANLNRKNPNKNAFASRRNWSHYQHHGPLSIAERATLQGKNISNELSPEVVAQHKPIARDNTKRRLDVGITKVLEQAKAESQMNRK